MFRSNRDQILRRWRRDIMLAYSFREINTVSQTTLVKLIVITNCKDLNPAFFFFFFFLACGNFNNLRCQGYLYFGSREKYFIVSYGMLIH